MAGAIMGQILHGSARTTEATRLAIQNSEESIRTIAIRYGINPKTVAKWKKRKTVSDSPMGPKEVVSTVLTREEEALIVAFRKHTLLPLDDCLYALQDSIPHLRRSSLHRCLQRHGISRLPDIEGEKPPKKKFKDYPIGFFHIDIAEVRTEEGKLHLFVAIDRTSKFVMVRLFERATMKSACIFLEELIAFVPYRIHTILTDNGIQFADLPKNRNGITAILRGHPFGRVCRSNSIEHRLTKPNHPWTNGQVERMNRTLKDATVNRYFYQSHEQLRNHLNTFVSAYNFAKRLKTLNGLSSYEFIVKSWNEKPDLFHNEPYHLKTGLYI
jgi:transposase InsO family protein